MFPLNSLLLLWVLLKSMHNKLYCNQTSKIRYSTVVFVYVYWSVHHLDSWIKGDQLDVTCFIISLFNVQHVLDVNTSILRSLRLIWWVISWVVLLWFNVCWCYVVVCLWWCGIWMWVEALVLQPTYVLPCNPGNNSTNKSQASVDGCINIQNMLSIK